MGEIHIVRPTKTIFNWEKVPNDGKPSNPTICVNGVAWNPCS